MKFISQILSILFIGVFTLKGSLFSVTSFLYENNNEVLTELCCVNKDTDKTCRAKCFLDVTKESSEQEEITYQKTTIDYFHEVDVEINKTKINFNFRPDNFSYQKYTLQSIIFRVEKPPTV